MKDFADRNQKLSCLEGRERINAYVCTPHSSSKKAPTQFAIWRLVFLVYLKLELAFNRKQV